MPKKFVPVPAALLPDRSSLYNNVGHVALPQIRLANSRRHDSNAYSSRGLVIFELLIYTRLYRMTAILHPKCFGNAPCHQNCVTELFRRSPIVRYKAAVPSDGTVKDFRDIASLLTEVEPRYVRHMVNQCSFD
jgi:hypothetical protein